MDLKTKSEKTKPWYCCNKIYVNIYVIFSGKDILKSDTKGRNSKGKK